MPLPPFPFHRLIVPLALLAAALVLAMLGLFVATGIGQEPLQYVHAAAEYQALLLRNPPVLRTVIGLDNAFLLVYGTLFVLLVAWLRGQGAPAPLPGVALGLLLATTLLDLCENLHFLTLLAGAELGQVPTDGAIAGQALESMVKFHVSYLGLLLLGLSLPGHTAGWRTLRGLLVAVQAPVGVAIYVVPHAFAVPLVFARFAFFLASFGLLAALFRGGAAQPAQVHRRDAQV